MPPTEAFAPPITAALPISRQMLLLIGAGLGLACGFAGLYFSTMAIFLKPMASSLGWTRADVSAATLVSMLGLAVGAPLQGLLSDRWGSRRVIGVSVLLLAAALFSFSWLPNSRLLLGSISFAMGALTVATGPSGYLSVLPRWFDRRLGLALSCAMVGVGLGAMVMPRIAQMLIEAQGWREAYRTLAGIALAGGGLAYFLLSAGEHGGRREVFEQRRSSSIGEGLSLSAAIGERRFWIIAVLMLIGGAGGLGTAIHLVALLDDRGVTPGQAAGAAALSGVGILLGRLTAGALLDFVRAPVVGAATYLLAGVGTLLVLMNFFHSFALIAVGAVLVGLAIGAEGDFVAFVVRRYFGRKSFASIYGCLLSAYAFGGVLGPVLFGIGFDHLGDYGLVLSLSIAGFALNVILSLTLGPYRFTAIGPTAAR